MTVVPVVPLVSSVSLAASVRYCSDIGACGAPGVLGVHCCFLRCCDAPGVLCMWLLVASIIPVVVPLVSLVYFTSVRYSA